MMIVVAIRYVLGISARRINQLVQTLGITGLTKIRLSEMAKDLDEHVTQFPARPLDVFKDLQDSYENDYHFRRAGMRLAH